MVHLISWLLAALANKCLASYDADTTILGKIRVFFWVSFPLTVFTFTSAEMVLMIAFQFRDMNWTTDLERASSMFSLFTMFYFIIVFFYQLYVINNS